MACVGLATPTQLGPARIHHQSTTTRCQPTPQVAARAPRRASGWRRRAFGGSGGGGGPNDGGDDPVDFNIDQLAARLAAEAERLRRLESEGVDLELDRAEEVPSPPRPAPTPPPADLPSPFGYDSGAQEADVLAAVGDGGFYASEFELLQELGQISIQQIEYTADDETRLPGAAAGRSARAAVIAYTASYFSGMPFQDPVVTLMKEYLPGAKAVACNELQVLKHLCGMPTAADKWRVAAAPLSQNPPIVELLGYFLAGPSERAVKADPSVQSLADADTIWVVQKWEGMAPLALYPSQQQTSGLGLGRLFGGADAAGKQRARMLRAIARGALRALAFCHDKAVVHGSVGSGSFLLSTFNDQDSMRLVVKLDNFGFARRVAMPPVRAQGRQQVPAGGADTPLSLGQQGDRRQLAVVLLECFLSALAVGGPSDRTSTDAVLRVLGDVFDWDVEAFRGYCGDEPEWEAAVALLDADEEAGWCLLRDLLSGGMSTAELAESRFCMHMP